jgi:hypothetical protein
VDRAHQIVREFDLAGNTLLETNAAPVNEQLALMGKRTISGFHHDAVEHLRQRLSCAEASVSAARASDTAAREESFR